MSSFANPFVCKTTQRQHVWFMLCLADKLTDKSCLCAIWIQTETRETDKQTSNRQETSCTFALRSWEGQGENWSSTQKAGRTRIKCA